MARVDDERIPFVSKELVHYLKEIYDTRFLLEICRRDNRNADNSIGYLEGVQSIIDRLDAISTRDDSD